MPEPFGNPPFGWYGYIVCAKSLSLEPAQIKTSSSVVVILATVWDVEFGNL